jgi:putative nucleotidyltransferase-like protein
MGVEEGSLERLKGVYRSSWTRNQLLYARLRAVLEDLIAVEIVPMLVRGMRLAMTFYDELALRPVRHIELVVEPPEFERALGVLMRMDWSMVTPVAGGARLEQAAFGRPADVVCVLGSELPRELRPARRGWADGTRTRRVQEHFEGKPILLLDPIDELFLAASGWRRPTGILQALVDAHTIVIALGPALDWQDFEARAADRGLSYRVLDVLSYLRRTLRTPVPADVLGDLAGTASTGRERVIRALEAMDGGLLGGFPVTLAEFARTTEATSALRAIHGLPRYLQHAWGLDRSGHVPVQMIKKGASRLRSRRRTANAA